MVELYFFFFKKCKVRSDRRSDKRVYSRLGHFNTRSSIFLQVVWINSICFVPPFRRARSSIWFRRLGTNEFNIHRLVEVSFHPEQTAALMLFDHNDRLVEVPSSCSLSSPGWNPLLRTQVFLSNKWVGVRRGKRGALNTLFLTLPSLSLQSAARNPAPSP